MGKPWENYGKTLEKDGKGWENSSWISWEKMVEEVKAIRDCVI